MSLDSWVFKRYRKLIVIIVVLMFLISTIPNVSAGDGKKKKDKPEPPFDLNATLEEVDESYKDYQALMNKTNNLEEELDELIENAKACKISGLDLEPYKNKINKLESELDDLIDVLKDLEKDEKKLKAAEKDNEKEIKNIKDDLKEKEGALDKKIKDFDKTLKALEKAEKKNPGKLEALMDKLDKIYEKIEKLEEEIEEKEKKNKDTSKAEKKLEELEDEFIKITIKIYILENETYELAAKLEGLFIDILTLENDLESLYSELATLESRQDGIEQALDKLKEMKKGKNKLKEELDKIKKKIKELEEIFKDKRKKRSGDKKESPKPLIETELVPLNLQGMSSTFGIIKVHVTDELDTSDPKESAENCMLQLSTDGRTWYPLELDLTVEDGFAFVYVATEPDKYYFKAAMCNWYGNLGFDDTSEDFTGNEPLEQLDQDISVINVSFTFWYKGYSINCVNQQQLIPQPILANDVNTIKNSLSNFLVNPVSKTSYQRSLVTFQDGEDIIAVGYAETSMTDSTPLRSTQGDSFAVLESDIVTRGNIRDHHFLAIPPYYDAPTIIINTSLGIIETPSLIRNSTILGITSTNFDCSVLFLNVDEEESLDWDYDICLRTNISYFGDVDRINDDHSIDFEGSIDVRENFTKQFGENVKTTLKVGGFLSAKVERSTFEYGDLGGLSVLADIYIGGSVIKLKGSLDGKVYSDYSIDFFGSLTVRENYTYKKGNVTATLGSGSSVTVEVKASKLVKVGLAVNFEVDTDIESDVTSALKLNGTIKGKYETNGSFDMTGSLTLVPPFKYKKSKLNVDFRSEGSVGVDVEQSAFKKAEFNVFSEVGITIQEINDTDLKLQGSLGGKYENERSKTSVNTNIQYGEILIFVIEKIVFPTLIGPEVESFETLFEQLISVEDLDGNTTNIITTQNLIFNSHWANINLSAYYHMGDPTDNWTDSRKDDNDRLGDSSRDTRVDNDTDTNSALTLTLLQRIELSDLSVRNLDNGNSSGASASAGFGASASVGFGASASAGFGASASAGFGASASAGFSASASAGFGTSDSDDDDDGCVDSFLDVRFSTNTLFPSGPAKGYEGRFEIEVDVNMIGEIGAVSERKNASDVDNDGKLDTGNDTNETKLEKAYFVKTSVGSEITVMFNPEKVIIKKQVEWEEERVRDKKGFSYYNRAFSFNSTIECETKGNNTMMIRTYDKFHRLTRGTSTRTWGDKENETNNDSTRDETRQDSNTIQNTRENGSSSRTNTSLRKIAYIFEYGEELEVMFNPKEFTVTKSVAWQEHRDSGYDVPMTQFTSGGTRVYKTGINFSSNNETELDKWIPTDRNDTNYYNNTSWGRINTASWCRISSSTSIGVSSTGWPNISSTMWGSISSSTWGSISSSTWGSISGSTWSSISSTMWGNISSSSWGRISDDQSDDNDTNNSGDGQFFVDSFFDITYEITPDHESFEMVFRSEVVLITGNSENSSTMTIAGFDLYHRLTRGTNSRTWGDGNSSRDDNDDRPEGDSYDRVLLETSMIINIFINDSEIEIHAEGMTKAELIGAVAGGINDSEDEQTARSGNTSGSKPPKIDHMLYFKSEFSIKLLNQKNESFLYYQFGEFMTDVIDDWDSLNRSAHANYSATFQLVNGSSYHTIFSKWSEIGPTTNFKLEIEGVDAGQFTSVEIDIEQEVINYDDHETFWCRVSTFMAGSSSGNWSLPEVDNEVQVALGQTFNTGDRPGLQDYSINFVLENLTAGKEPKYKIDTCYNFTGNTSYWGNVSYSVRTINNNSVNETYIYLKVDTYEKTVDKDGGVVNKLLFTDVFKIKYNRMINIDSRSGSASVRETLELAVESVEYK